MLGEVGGAGLQVQFCSCFGTGTCALGITLGSLVAAGLWQE